MFIENIKNAKLSAMPHGESKHEIEIVLALCEFLGKAMRGVKHNYAKQ